MEIDLVPLLPGSVAHRLDGGGDLDGLQRVRTVAAPRRLTGGAQRG